MSSWGICLEPEQTTWKVNIVFEKPQVTMVNLINSYAIVNQHFNVLANGRGTIFAMETPGFQVIHSDGRVQV